jgi:hypothetical protein
MALNHPERPVPSECFVQIYSGNSVVDFICSIDSSAVTL